MDAMEILVIILSSFLALFLLLSIILVVMLIRVTKRIENVTTTAQSAADQINSIATNVGKVTTPAVITKVVLDQLKKFRK